MITAERIDFRYRRGPRILTDFSAVVTHSEMIAITGSSGRGKSTLLYILGTVPVIVHLLFTFCCPPQ